jgi:EpsI family protein
LKLRFICAAASILLAAVLLQGRTETIPHGLPLSSFPTRLGSWTGTDIQQEQEILDVLGPGDFLLRDYQTQSPNALLIGLWIAYFPSQRAGDTIHSPLNCLPGSGWTPVENRRVTLTFAGHKPFPANRYVVTKADARELVLYWYWAHDRGVASEYWAKYYLVRDSIRMNRSDGALVRITTPMLPAETPEAAEQRILPFADYVGPLLDNYIPR